MDKRQHSSLLVFKIYLSGLVITQFKCIRDSISIQLKGYQPINMAGRLKVAVLDDYFGFAGPIFQKLDDSKFEVTIFKDTLLPYNHPGTPQDEKDKLAKRLEPFQIICEHPQPCTGAPETDQHQAR